MSIGKWGLKVFFLDLSVASRQLPYFRGALDPSVASRQLPYLRGASEGHWDLNSSLYDVVDLIAD